MLTLRQKRTAQAILNIFETGSARGDYARVTLLPGDSGHLTYGRSQTTLASGNLFLLLKAYCEAPGSLFARELTPFLPRLLSLDLSLDHDDAFRTLLKRAGADPVMHQAQDAFFDRVYWEPAARAAASYGIASALGTAVVYDGFVHGSWKAMRDRTSSRYASPSKIGERAWIARYVSTRRDWLATHPNALLRGTVYRMDAFASLIEAGRWDLATPLSVRGVLISEADLEPPKRPSADEKPPRLLLLQEPHLRGDDVRALQIALSVAGLATAADGDFGPRTDANVRLFQGRRGLKADGIVGAATRAALHLG